MTREEYNQLYRMYSGLQKEASFLAKIPSYGVSALMKPVKALWSGVKWGVKNPKKAFVGAAGLAATGYAGSKVYKGVRDGIQNVPHLPNPQPPQM